MAALQPRTGQRAAPGVRRGHHQGIASALVTRARGRPGVVVTNARDDLAGQVDALVAAVAPRLGSPTVHRRDFVLVTGPGMAGVTGVGAALRQRLQQQKFVESAELGAGDAPSVVVFVVSAVAPLTESDCALLDAAAEHTDVLVGVVSKIDVHRGWRDVLAANREILTAHSPRYAQV